MGGILLLLLLLLLCTVFVTNGDGKVMRAAAGLFVREEKTKTFCRKKWLW
jgi:uncharacterized membrane protein YphA (DoxX/SURF4 family)